MVKISLLNHNETELRIEGLDKIVKDIEKGIFKKNIVAKHTNVHGGNVVYEADSSYINVIPDASRIILKSNPSFDVINAELKSIKSMHNQNLSGRHGIEVVNYLNPEIIRSKDGQNYLLLQKGGPSLKGHTKNMNFSELTSLFSRIARFTAISHLRIGKSKEGINEYEDYLKYRSRILKISAELDKNIHNEIIEIMQLIDEPMKTIYKIFEVNPIFYRKDPKVDNWHFKPDSQINYTSNLIAIDWEGDRKLCPPEFEISKLIYQGSHLNGGSHTIMKEVVSAYLEEFKKITGRTYLDLPEFIQRTYLANIPKSFTLTSYAFDKPNLRDDINSYLTHAVESIQLLRENSSFNDSLKPTFSSLYEGMKQLEHLMQGAR